MKIPSAKFIKGIRGTDPIMEDGVPQIAFVGRSNVGKSSLIATITYNKNLARVSNKPGKTREINFFLVDKKFYLVDLPGYGYADVGPKEKEKLKKLIIWYLTDSGVRPKIVVLVLDCKVGITKFDAEMLVILKDFNHHYIVAVNKADKLTRRELDSQLNKIHQAVGDSEIIPTSAISSELSKTLTKKIFAS